MLSVNQLVGFGVGVAVPLVLTQVTDYTGTTNIGNMTGSGGLAAAFDGTTSQAFGSGADRPGSNTTPAYIGKLWAASKIIGRFKIHDPSNEGHCSSGASVIPYLYGSNSAPANPTDGTLLFTGPSQAYSIPEATYDTTDTNNITITTAYTYHWVTLTPSASTGSIYLAEVIFWELI